MKQIKAIYPGSFDPLTNGHLDLIERGSKIFHELVVAILKNSEKEPLFDVVERREMITEATSRWPNVKVDTFSGLLVDYVVKQKANAVLRGIRAISDYEYELQMALMNRKLNASVETIFMMPAEAYSYLSSRLVKEVFRLGGSVRGLVPPNDPQPLDEDHARRLRGVRARPRRVAPPAAPAALIERRPAAYRHPVAYRVRKHEKSCTFRTGADVLPSQFA